MESIVQSSNDSLIHMLNFKSPDTASFVTDRHEANWAASGSNIYDSDLGVKTIRLNLTGQTFFDPGSLMIQFKVRSKIASDLKPLTGPWSFIKRLTVTCSGANVEDILYYNRCHELLDGFHSKEKRLNTHAMGFGCTVVDGKKQDLAQVEVAHGAAGMYVIFFPSALGISNCGKWIPLWALGSSGLVYTIELAPGAEVFDASGSQQYEISDVRAFGNTYSLNSELQNKYATHLLEGKQLNINFRSWSNTMISLLDSDTWTAHVARSFTRLNTVFLTTVQDGAEVNEFYAPKTSENVEGWLQIGDKRWSDMSTATTAQWMYRLFTALGTLGSAIYPISMSREDFKTKTAVFAWDTEKVPASASYSGHNCSTGALISVNMKNFGTAPQGTDNDTGHARRAYLFCHYDVILSLTDQGANVLS